MDQFKGGGSHLLGREADIWEPLFAIAVALGGNWYEKVCGLVEDEPQKLDEGGTTMFWEATRYIVNQLRASGYKEDIIQPADYAKRLAEWEDENGIRPYADYHNVYSMDGKRIQANDIRNILRPYGIKSIHQTMIIIICVMIAAQKVALDFTNFIKKANKNTPKIFP